MNGSFDVLLSFMHGQEHNFCPRPESPHFLERLKPVQFRHRDIKHDHVRVHPNGFIQSATAISDSANDIETAREEVGNGVQNLGMIVSYEDSRVFLGKLLVGMTRFHNAARIPLSLR